MMRQYELTERVLSYNPDADEALLNKAYVYAMKAHAGVKRNNGDPYFSHPLEVAAILTDLKLDDATIATALLHDVVEDTDVTKDQIDQTFGPEIGSLVNGLTKIMRLDLVSRKAQQAESFRKLLLAISSDVRVLLVKLADRLHNMRTLHHNKPASQKRNAEETLEIYAPLAGRMGMQGFREELEELSFKCLHPGPYSTIVAELAELRVRNAGLVDEIGSILTARLADAGIKAEVSGREKKPYAIWRKMENKQISLEKLSDIYGFRVLVDTPDTCYRALGIAHGHWRTVPGRFKDYISSPKQNNYQSIHTTIQGPRNQRVELQIRTHAMHEVAEVGIAAHALYKDRLDAVAPDSTVTVAGASSAPAKETPYRLLRQMVASLLDGNNPEEFLEDTKLELFQEQVFCFTPKGRIISLPRGATPIDFAYGVHTDVGNSCIGAIVNGHNVPLTAQLRNGDEVQILTKDGQTPPAAWEKIAITGRARALIRRATRDTERRQSCELGRRLLAAAAAKAQVTYDDDQLRGVVGQLGYKSSDDALIAVSRQELSVRNALTAIHPGIELVDPAPRPKPPLPTAPGEVWVELTHAAGMKFRLENERTLAGTGAGIGARTGVNSGVISGAYPTTHSGISVPIRGRRNDIPIVFEDTGVLPGDRIIGILDGHHGIRVFQIHSLKLQAYDSEHWIDMRWEVPADKQDRFPARITVTVLNVPGTLAKVAGVIGEAGGNIDSVRMARRAPDFTEMHIDLEVFHADHLNSILMGLKAQDVVHKAERMYA